MLIKNISRLKNFGIFKNCNNSGVNDFGKYNLFFGWNGSGKSTLSNVFRCLEQKAMPAKFSIAEFALTMEDNSTLTQDNVTTSALNIYTFNQDFIDENISWNTVAKSILLVDKTKIKERTELEELKKQQQADQEKSGKEISEIQSLEESILKFGTNSARHIKMSLQSIDTTDSYFLNYDRRKFDSLINSVEDDSAYKSGMLTDQDVISLTNSAKPIVKKNLIISLPFVNSETFGKAHLRLTTLLQTNIISKTIERLVKNNDIKMWVEAGLQLHRHHESLNCEFCGGSVTSDRLTDLDAHFNDSYKSFQESLVKADTWLDGQYIQFSEYPDPLELYDEFRAEYVIACTEINSAIKLINNELSEWHRILRFKRENLLTINTVINIVTPGLIERFSKAGDKVKSVIDKHNHKTANFGAETTKAKKRLEFHYAATEVQSFQLTKKKNSIETKKNSNNALRSQIANRQIEIQKLEKSLSNENLGADQFNECLHKFLGRAELTLRFNSIKKGYEIIRNLTDLVNGRLSEGEKTAIAFVYFITKLNENSNKVEETIVVVDDPVSSFDSNHLFHAYSFLRNHCNSAKQIFILTHNFTYFKLVRDWFDGINKNRQRKNPAKAPNAFIFSIEASSSLPRASTLKNADASLCNYNSEYHYIFSRLHNYCSKSTLSIDDSFLTANLTRKLLEAFFSFKFPLHRGDIAQLMQRGLSGCTVTTEITKEKIYRFINKYSHNIVIDINEDTAENLASESGNVIHDVFTWIREVDEIHYDEMVLAIT
jgi:wobble nucleotide-excising tRNase